MPATPKKGRRFGGSSPHQRLMMANLVASLVAAEGIVTTEAKAKALRPVAEKVITKAKKGGLHNHRQVVVVPRRQGDGPQAVRRDRPPLRRPQRWLHPDPQARPPPGRQRPHGPHRAGLSPRPRTSAVTLFDPSPTTSGPSRAAGPRPAAGRLRRRGLPRLRRPTRACDRRRHARRGASSGCCGTRSSSPAPGAPTPACTPGARSSASTLPPTRIDLERAAAVAAQRCAARRSSCATVDVGAARLRRPLLGPVPHATATRC